MIIEYNHRHSGHCESGATANLLSYYGLNISEPMAFGIGSGLYFSYFPFMKALDAPLIAFRSIPGRIFRNTTRRLNVETTMIKKIKDPAEAMNILDRNLEKGIPTGIQVGTYHLKYFPEEYRMHYNFHNVVVFGKEDGIYHIGEPVREKSQILTHEDLKKARYAKGHFGPGGKMYYIEGIRVLPDMERAVFDGIRQTVRDMIQDPFPFIGVRGMRMLARHMKKWPDKLPGDKAVYYLMQFVRSIEEFGTGGAGFRYIYGSFLKESGTLLNHEGLLEASRMMGNAASRWREFSYRGARFIKNRSESGDDFQVLSGLVLECAAREEEVFRYLVSLHP
jgi:hypothetical protein